MSGETNQSNVQKLGMRERICYGCGGMGNAIVLAIVSTFLMFFYTDVVGLSAGIIGTIMLASKVLDGISDLIMGYIVDKTNSKYGKARCWQLWLCVPYAVAGVLLFLLQPTWPDTVKYVYVFITYNLVNTVMYTGVCVPYNAMNCLITNDQYERGVLGTTNVMGNVVGQILVNTFMLKLVKGFGNDQKAWIIGSAIFGIIGIIMHLVCFTQTVERNAGDSSPEDNPGFAVSVKSLLKNKYWMIVTAMAIVLFFLNGVGSGCTMYFAKLVVHDEGAVAGLTNSMNMAQIVMYFCAFGLIKKLGKGGCFRVGFTLAAIGYLMQAFVGGNYTLLMVSGVIRGLGIGMGAACLGGIISDTIEYGEWKTGVRCVGVGNAANTFAQKVGMGVGSAIVGWMLSIAGYSASLAEQSPAVLKVVNICYTYIPFVGCVIIVILAMNYKLDKQYPQIMKELEERHQKKAKEKEV